MLTNNAWTPEATARSVLGMDTVEAYEVAKRVCSTSTGVDSSHLRGGTTSRAQQEGPINVEKYNRVNAVLSSVEVFDGLVRGVEET